MENKLYPLTHPQKRIWLQSKQDPGSLWPLNVFIVRYHKPVDFAILSMALNQYIAENDGLRIRIVPDNENTHDKQQFFQHTDREWEFVDFTQPDTPGFNRWLEREKSRSVNLYDDYLYDFCLLKLPTGNGGFTMRIHHICSDGTTVNTLAQRVTTLYQNLVQGKPQEPVLNTSYREFADYEETYKASPRFLHDQQFWLSENLHELTEYTLSSGSKKKGAEQNNIIRYDLPSGLLDAMNRFKKESGVSLFKQFFAALALYIHRVSTLQSFAISFCGRNRPAKAMETTAGMYVGIYPLRVDITEDVPFSELMHTIADKINRVVNVHGSYPFDEVVRLNRELHKTDVAHLINVSLIELFYPGNENYSIEQLHRNDIQNQLTMYIERYENPHKKPAIHFLYNSNYYQPEDIHPVFEGITSILEGFFLNPVAKIGALSLLPKEKYHQLVHTFNQTEKLFPKEQCTHHLFEQTALRYPSHVAIESEGHTITYHELNRQADDLAKTLKTAGVSPEQLAGIFMHRSVEVVIAMLAVLKAGGAYVPIDPGLPVERIRFILRDINAPCLIVDQHLVDKAKDLYDGQMITCSNGSFQAINVVAHENCSETVKLENLMYVIYTSGSTGEPKGVMIEHHGFVNLITDQVRRFKLTKNDRVLHYLSLGFDASQEHLFKALCSGAILCLVDINKANFKLDIRELLKSLKITCCAFPASLLETLNEKEYPLLKTVSSGADKCPPEMIKRWGNGRRFFNAYGPTETTVLSSIAQLNVSDTEPHIGKPIANTQVYVLDRYNMPLPIGMEGELFIGGEGVARGYLNRPDLTRERFIPNPFDASGKTRLYRTGDIVRFRKDGNICFVGRCDDQVKIRGFRIEPGEIEAVIRQHPMVEEATVFVNDSGNKKQLLACFTSANKNEPDPATLNSFLSERLPAYMIPDMLTEVDSIPLTINGKIDRKALLKSIAIANNDNVKIPPKTETEHRLKDIWCTILNTPNAGVTENFYYSGGDSLMTLKICAAIEKQFGKKISVRQFMDSPSIRSVAKIIDREKTVHQTVTTVKQSPASKGSMIIAHSPNGDPNWGSILGRKLDGSFDIYGTSIDEPILEDIAAKSVQDLASFHINKLMKREVVSPVLVSGFSWGGLLAYEMALLLEKSGIRTELLLIDTKYPDLLHHRYAETSRPVYHLLSIAYYILQVMMQVHQIFRKWVKTYFKKQSFKTTGDTLPIDSENPALSKKLRALRHTLSPCPPSLKIHYIKANRTSLPDKLLKINASDVWEKHAARPLNSITLKGRHLSLIYENLPHTVKFVQETIDAMTAAPEKKA